MKDPFALLGLSPEYTIDLRELQEKHKRLSLELHPDRLRERLPRERREALSLAMEVNQAYRKLRDPAERARALASLRGLNLNEDESRAQDKTFLMDMMELQETLAEREASRDARGLMDLLGSARAESDKVQTSLAEAFKKEQPDVGEVATLIGRLRYYARLVDQAELAYDNLPGEHGATRHL